jgi:hypothetical protein
MSAYYDYAEDTVRTWLQEPIHLPDDGRLRVAQLVHETPQQRHWWPTFPNRRSQAMFSAPRVVAAGITIAIISGSLMLAPRWLQAPVVTAPAVASPSPSPAPDVTVAPAPTERIRQEAAHTSTFAATSVIARLPDGSDPIDLVPAPPQRPGAVYIDRTTNAVMHVDDAGVLRVLMQKDIEDYARTMKGDPIALAPTGSGLVVLDGDGAAWTWADWKEVGRAYGSLAEALPDGADLPEDTPPVRIARPVAMDATPVNDLEYDLLTIDAADGSIRRYEARQVVAPDVTYEREGHEYTYPSRPNSVLTEGGDPIMRQGLPAARDIAVDGPVYVLTADSVERYTSGLRDADFALEAIAGSEPDYRLLASTGSGDDGELWLFDAASGSFASFDKTDGTYLGSWMPDSGAPGDVRGMYVTDGAAGAADSVTWLTGDSVLRGALADPVALQPNVTPAPDPQGQLTESERSPGKAAIDWSDGGVELKADAVTLRVGDRVVRPPAGVSVYGNTEADVAQLEMEWLEDGIEQRINFVIEVDDTHWWIAWIWAYDGEKSGDWINFENLESVTRTPLGESLTGDLVVKSTSAEREKYDTPGTATLRFDGLRLSAMVPGTRPAPLTGCKPLVDDRFQITREAEWDSRYDTWSTSYSSRLLREPGEPLYGLKDMTPKEVEAVLKDLGICYRFRYEWSGWQRLDDGTRHARKYYDYRCTAPDSGNVIALNPGPGYPAADGTAVIYVIVREKGVRDWPAPPPAGTDCPTQ